jgi:RIO kinase 2
MSSAQVAARSIKDLEPEDWEVLNAIEKSITSFESVPLERIEKLCDLHPDQLKFRLDRLNFLGFVMRTPFGYNLNTAGLDVIALNGLVKRNLISGMGRAVGMGKESDVFETISDKGEQFVVKFYRIGRISFRTTRKSRAYTSPESQHQWLTVNIHAAMKEEEGLLRAAKVGISTPKFIGREKHAVVMSAIDGKMLYKCSEDDVRAPRRLLTQLLEDEKRAFLEAKMINGDLSEYNVLYDGEKPWIIDWPQFVDDTHPNAQELLKRDVENSISYFVRKFGVKLREELALAFVQGKRKTF